MAPWTARLASAAHARRGSHPQEHFFLGDIIGKTCMPDCLALNKLAKDPNYQNQEPAGRLASTSILTQSGADVLTPWASSVDKARREILDLHGQGKHGSRPGLLAPGGALLQARGWPLHVER